jgi:hypothetical protein
MLPRALSAAALLPCLVASVAGAAEVNGYVDSRTQLSRVDTGSLIDTRDLPQFDQLLEFNAQVKHSYAETGFVSGDLSLFARVAGSFRTADAEGNRVVVPDHDVPALRPLASINELYLSHDLAPELSLLAGKKRIIWGPGMAFNPTDLMNPLKDPTDPTFQRAGAYLARVELPLERYTFSLLASPQVLAQQGGIPYRMLKDANGYHFLVAARVYALVADTDVNVIAMYTNLYNDQLEHTPRVGLTFSRVFFDALELHFEGLGQTGSSRIFVEPECVTDRLAAMGCVATGTPIAGQPLLEDDGVVARLLVGARYQFADDSMASVEYLFQSDGYTPAQFQDLVSGLTLASEARKAGLDLPFNLFGPTDPGIPQKFTFEPRGRHYLFLTFQKPRIAEDFTAQLVVIANAQDLSTLISPSVSWSTTEWLTLSASGFLPLPGPAALAATRPDTGDPVSEYSLVPIQFRGVLEARVFY